MTTILVCCAALILLAAALILLLCYEPLVARWYYRLFPSRSVYPPEAAEAPEPDPVDAVHDDYQRAAWFTDAGVPVVPSDHPTDCAQKCCFEIRLTELVEQFDWHAAEHEMRSTQ